MRASVGSIILVREHESPSLVERDVGWTRRDEEGSRAVLLGPVQSVPSASSKERASTSCSEARRVTTIYADRIESAPTVATSGA
jgi:hypothetical protein